MNTIRVSIEPFLPFSPESIQGIRTAAGILMNGGIVAFPTETVYGLGAAIDRPAAIRSIFAVKGRPSDNPLIMHVSDKAMLAKYAEIDEQMLDRFVRFMPGPLTLVLPARKGMVPPVVSAGLTTVAVRIPRNEIALALIEATGVPIVAPSANKSGKPSCTNASDVLTDFNGEIAMILDGGACSIGLESTVISLCVEPPEILRPGGITIEELKCILPNIRYHAGSNDSRPASPGMKYRHYKPDARIALFSGSSLAHFFRNGEMPASFSSTAEERRRCICYLHSPELRDLAARAGYLYRFYPDATEWGRHLYASFRADDRSGLQLILVERWKEEAGSSSILNRLAKAADFDDCSEKP